jgi:serine/threonine protein kinase
LTLESVFYNSLGKGTQFEVFRHIEVELVAKRVNLHVMVCNKLVQLRNLELEIRALASPKIYEHPNIVDLLDWGYDTMYDLPPAIRKLGDVGLPLRVPVLDVEPANEGSLEKFLSAPRTWNDRNKICLDVAAGWECLGGCRILHNDLKPENVRVFKGKDGGFTAKFGDFGFALDPTKNTNFTFAQYGRTPSWRPPESLNDYPEQDASCTDDLLFRSESYV